MPPVALPVKFTLRGTSPDVGEAEDDASSGITGALAFIVKESES
jgi:hypothetical protein